MGKDPTFADFAVVSLVISFKKIWGPDSSKWKDVSSWNNGRWGALVKALEKYETMN